ncbi:hypothetical protein, partial [Pseudomonas meliae]|uniref:hypothetical protein n=1 Tax=Pseudomonas meliae TaxID=86176 RepID=UPI001F3A3381
IISNSPSLPTWHDSNKRVSEKPGAVQYASKAKSAFKIALLTHIKQTNPSKPTETSCTITRPHPTQSANGRFFSTESDS